jgi:CHAD domain-containing protein
VERLLARESALADVDHPDGLRRYRVAIRRLRAALRLFGEAYTRREVKPLRRDLADLAQAVGTVRDLDLRIADVNRWALERGDPSPLAVEPLVASWAAERTRALAALLDRVDSRRHRRLLHDLVAFVDAPEEADRRSRFEGAHTISDRAGSRIWAAYEEVRAFAEIVRWADVETLHGLRIATKRLRDDLEFLGGILGPDAAPLLERLVALQDHLGAMNDAAVTAAAVRSFLERHHPDLAPVEQAEIARYLADREREVARLRRSSVWPWRRVTAITFARRLARLMVLPAARA